MIAYSYLIFCSDSKLAMNRLFPRSSVLQRRQTKRVCEFAECVHHAGCLVGAKQVSIYGVFTLSKCSCHLYSLEHEGGAEISKV